MKIDRLIYELTTRFRTSDPFTLAGYLSIEVIIESLGLIKGFYNIMYGHKFIHISETIPYEERDFICAHELAHALLHPELNAMYSVFYYRKYERQANTFAVKLLLNDAKCEYQDYDLFQLGCITGIPKSILLCLKDDI